MSPRGKPCHVSWPDLAIVLVSVTARHICTYLFINQLVLQPNSSSFKPGGALQYGHFQPLPFMHLAFDLFLEMI